MTTRLQDLRTISTDTAQPAELAIDLGNSSVVTVCVRKPVAAGTGLLYMQHSISPEEGSFVDFVQSFNLANTTSEVFSYTGLLRYLRWRSMSVTGTGSFLVDVVPHRHTASPGFYPLVGLTTQATSPYTPPLDQAIDVMRFNTITLATNVSVAGTGSIVFQTAPILDESAFTDISGATVSLTPIGIKITTITAFQRYLRWKVGALTGTPVFKIDLVAREY